MLCLCGKRIVSDRVASLRAHSIAVSQKFLVVFFFFKNFGPPNCADSASGLHVIAESLHSRPRVSPATPSTLNSLIFLASVVDPLWRLQDGALSYRACHLHCLHQTFCTSKGAECIIHLS